MSISKKLYTIFHSNDYSSIKLCLTDGSSFPINDLLNIEDGIIEFTTRSGAYYYVSEDNILYFQAVPKSN